MTDWRSLMAPDLAAFEAMALRAYAELPAEFRAFTGEVIIMVDDFATDEVLDDLNIESPFDLLGLFQGIGLAQGPGAEHTGQMPNQVTLYRRAILDYWAEHEETLGSIVTHVLIHEIGHHFGLSDDDMEALEAAAG